MLSEIYKTTLMLIFMTGITTVSLAGMPVEILNVDFNDKVPGSVLGAGGAALGEPISSFAIDTEIIETSPGENHLKVDNDLSSSGARSLTWEFLNNAEIASGLVVFFLISHQLCSINTHLVCVKVALQQKPSYR